MNTLDFLSRLSIASYLDSTAIQALSTELELQKIPSGAVLFNQGDSGDALYVIASGRLRANICFAGEAGSFASDLGPGEFVGEMALLTGQPRSATVLALEDCELLRLAKPVYERLVQNHPNLFSALSSQLLPRFQRDQTRFVMKRIFGDLEDKLLRELLGKLDCCHLESGQTLFRQGEPGEAMYIIVQGRLRFALEEPCGTQRVLGEAGAGECVGEFSLLAESGTPESLRTATVYAAHSTDLISITRPVFEDLICQYPRLLLNLTRQIVRRTTSHDIPVPSGKNNMVIVLLPLRAGQGMDRFAGQLTDSLTALGSTMFLNAERFEGLYGMASASETPPDHPLSLVIDVWLDEREREHQYTVYETSSSLDESGHLNPWTCRCLEDADVVLLVAEADSDSALTEVEQALQLLGSRSRFELVLLHSVECRIPHGTAEWLASRRSGDLLISGCHHIRPGNQADFRRMARRIIGKPVGLTFAGGGARGWAHVGVLQALEEAGLEFDYVAGASMGAIVAAGCAMDWSSGRLRELASRFSNPKKLLDYTLPYASITSTRHITSLLQELCEGADIEDTWRPFFCVSANLTLGEERLHTSGPLWKAVRASMAFPGIFAPILEEGCILIDGGAANNLPIDHMRAFCPGGTVIGVDLVESSPVKGQYDFGPSLSGWEVLRGRLFPFSRPVKAPTMLDVIAGVVYSNNRYRLNEVQGSADLLIRVPVEAYGLLEFDKYVQIIDVGYQAARAHLEKFSLS